MRARVQQLNSVSSGGVRCAQSSGGKLQRAAGAPHRPRQPIGPEPVVDDQHHARSGEECHVDGKPHPERVQPLAGRQVQPLALIQPVAPQEAAPPGRTRVRHDDVRSQHHAGPGNIDGPADYFANIAQGRFPMNCGGQPWGIPGRLLRLSHTLIVGRAGPPIETRCCASRRSSRAGVSTVRDLRSNP